MSNNRSVSDLQLHYEVHGEVHGEVQGEVCGRSDKPTIIMVHGHLSSRNHWLPNLPALVEKYRVITVDLPAHGHSPAPDDATFYTIASIVQNLEQIRHDVGADSLCLIGQSFGAGIVLHYALTYPQYVQLIVITNANRALLPPPDAAEQSAVVERISSLHSEGAAQILRERVHPRFAKRYPEHIRNTLVEDARQIDPIGFAHLLRECHAAVSARDQLAQIDCPILLINGRHERKFQTIRDELEALYPEWEIVDLDGGHSINIENAVGFDQAATTFLAKHLSRNS